MTELYVSTISKDLALQSLAYAYSLVFDRVKDLPTTARNDILNIMQVLESELIASTETEVMIMTRIRYNMKENS